MSDEFYFTQGRSKIAWSPKHCFNPSISVCFWCSRPDGTLLLLGKIRGTKDARAPRTTCGSYEPCDECAKVWARGIFVAEVYDPGQAPKKLRIPEIIPGCTPTGRWAVIGRESQIFELMGAKEREEIFRRGRCCLPRMIYDVAGCDPSCSGSEIELASLPDDGFGSGDH